jgi:hypothetical protein
MLRNIALSHTPTCLPIIDVNLFDISFNDIETPQQLLERRGIARSGTPGLFVVNDETRSRVFWNCWVCGYSGRFRWPRGLRRRSRPLGCWDREFESRWGFVFVFICCVVLYR